MLEPLEQEIRTLHAILGSERDPEGRAFVPLADAYRRAGQPRKALGLLADGLRRTPDAASGHVVAARLYAEQGLLQEGELAARKALQLDPANVSAMAVLSGVLVQLGNRDEARDLRSILVDLEPEILLEEGVVWEEEEDDEPVLELADLAPDEPVLEVAELAPDEVVMELADLAPDEVVLELADLAPDEVVMELADLAPDEPVRVVADLAWDEAVLEVAELAPDEVVMELADLAPDEPVRVVADLAWDEAVLEVAELAPDEVVLELADLAPDEPVPGLTEIDPEEPAEGPTGAEEATIAPAEASAPRIYTRTLAELYAKQGFLDRAAEVLRQLRAERPDDEDLAARLAELEGRMGGDQADLDDAGTPPEPEPTPGPAHAERERARDEELEALARDLVGHRQEPLHIDTPFAWTDGDEPDEEAQPAEEGPTLGQYFDEILRFRPGERA